MSWKCLILQCRAIGKYSWLESLARSMGHAALRNRSAAANGAVDSSFACTLSSNAPIFTVVIQPDGKILIGGTFYSVNGFTQYGVARLNSDGSRDTSFTLNLIPIAGSRVSKIGLQPDGKMVVGGNFTANIDGVAKTALGRLNANGTLDIAFNPVLGTGTNMSGTVMVDAMAVQGTAGY